jgi:SAM-dependent methyltransferase|tara:strand:- start:945 stop:1733 length:789 start_codon:yes stop_codon:yes gene_type:complete
VSEIDALHDIRKKDIEILFGNCPENKFAVGIELGAGDGYQSRLLKKYIKHFTCTEYDEHIFNKMNRLEGVNYLRLDVAEIENHFPPKTFDLIFSSNVLEHVIDIGTALRGMRKVLKDDGVMIHVMPNRIWKFVQMILWVPGKSIINLRKRLIDSPQDLEQSHIIAKDGLVPSRLSTGELLKKLLNNLKPRTHGISQSNYREFVEFGKGPWAEKITNAGFQVKSIKKMQFHTPYRIEPAWIRQIFTSFGISCAAAYICKKRSN